MKRCLSCECTFNTENWTCPSCAYAPALVRGQLAFAPDLADENTGYDPKVFLSMPAPDDDHFWALARHELFTWAFRRYFPHASSFLEVGSATGRILNVFRRAFPLLQICGTELYLSGVETIAKAVDRVQVFQADARHLPFTEEFDVVGAFDVIEHVEQDRNVLKELYRATKPGGGVIVSVPQHPFLWSQRDEYLCHKRRYTRPDLENKLLSANFEIVHVSSFVTLPFPLMALAALRNRRPRPNYDPHAELRIGRITSEVLTTMLTCERQLIKVGVSLPFGGSLLAIAKRR